MGGWRSVRVWIEKPAYYHTPEGGFTPRQNKNAKFQDIGWAVESEQRSLKFKSLVKQDAELEKIAWSLIAWSACSNNVKFEEWEKWADKVEVLDGLNYTNWENLMFHRTRDSDLSANVHHKRFLMQVNLRTNECKIITPTVHIFHVGKPFHQPSSHETIETQDITIDLATRRYYECPELDKDIPF